MEPIQGDEWKSLASIVVDRIKEALIKRELKPGDRLPSETELAQQLGVARTSIREAVKMLQALGVLEVRRGDGTFVVENIPPRIFDIVSFALSLVHGSAEQIVDLREMFEIAYTRLAIDRATDEDIARMKAAVERLQRAYLTGTASAEDDLEFHYAVLSATHNPYIAKLGELLMEFLRLSISESVTKKPERAVADHTRLLDAIIKRDKAMVDSAVRESLSYWRTNVK